MSKSASSSVLQSASRERPAVDRCPHRGPAVGSVDLSISCKLSVDGLNDALMDIVAVRDQGNPGLRLLGVVMSKVDMRTRMAAVYTDKIRREFEAAGEMGAFEALISRSTVVEQAQAEGKTIFQLFPDHKVTGQYRGARCRSPEASRGRRECLCDACEGGGEWLDEPTSTMSSIRRGRGLAALASAPPEPQSELPASPPPDKPGGASRPRKGQGGAGSVARPQRRGRNYLTVNRKVMITEDEAERFAEATLSISSAFGSQVTYSQITWAVACGAQDASRTPTRRIPRIPVPSMGDHAAMAEYEQALADFLEVAIKRS